MVTYMWKPNPPVLAAGLVLSVLPKNTELPNTAATGSYAAASRAGD